VPFSRARYASFTALKVFGETWEHGRKIIHDARVRAKSDGVPKETGDGAKLAAVWAASARLDRNQVETLKLHSLQERPQNWRDLIELVEVYRLPGNLRISIEIRLLVLAESVDRCVDILKPALFEVLNDPGPCFIGLAQRDCVSMTSAPASSQRLIGKFGDMRTAHDYRNSGCPQRISGAIGSRDHPGHGADADHAHSLVSRVLHQFFIVHRLRVPIEQQNVMFGRRKRLKKEHPQMRHEVAGNAVVWIIE
jgi:hypothetical protein